MRVDAGAGGRAEVDADVEAVGMERALQTFDRPGDQIVEFKRFLAREAAQVGGVAVGDDHQVSRAVRVGIEDDEAGRAAVDDEVLFVVAAVSGKGAEDALFAAAFRAKYHGLLLTFIPILPLYSSSKPVTIN